MHESVQAEVMMSFLVSEELSFRIPVELSYRTCDPYAVRFTFHLPGDSPVTWAFGRELLYGGLRGACGEGDVRIAPDCPEDEGESAVRDTVLIRLQVGHEQAVFRVGAAPLAAFLDRTGRILPLGEERGLADYDALIDRALDRILAEEPSAG
ncbi:SsgA family sporulation/cell division regulator [Streptomyces sp. NPDC050560]|uniref:SsgA family sporulation/cell division regulator n=1 Tax=Streptomyces sp. NPDC050560 TaxID=3365630 RepID=UPI0037BDF107